MWLLPALARVSGIASRTFYRLTLAGEPVPHSGPVLLVANHPNSLLDPALVAAAAGRPVRFLAKAPLFGDPAVGWLVRGSGAIPVFRPAEDPEAAARNANVFQAVHAALAGGSAVGIFPEGTTHNEPSLVPLKTGAARMALGAAALTGAAFPIIPVGLTFRDKERFRSDALAVVGEPVSWEDLADQGDAAARELTRRIDAALRRVTVNVERWEDRPLLEAAEAIYAAEAEASPAPAQRVSRLQEAAQTLAELRRYAPERWQTLAADVEEHRRMLAALGASPESLRRLPAGVTALRWTAGKAAIWLVAGPLLLLGSLLFWLPYRAPGSIVTRLGVSEELRATYKVLIGFVALVLWIGAAVVTLAWVSGAITGLAALVVMPLFAAATLVLRDRWHDTISTARRFLQLRRGRELRAALRERQHKLALRLTAFANSEIPHSSASR
ncbi:MAG: 1-acyl-sn-glycerol-3-phosphate acyltransferase [Gemmatimonadota bacterium]|nr:1-acyl-sn-glycerol-3-phosphate acyltransferase [Gemmatimonadota bacterium]